jgi:transcription elongation factor GreA
MSSDRTFLTRDGLKKLEEELEFLRTTRRAQVAERLHNAQEDGELIENAEYEDDLLVGAAEANPKEGRISNESPLGRALLGRRVGDEVKVQAPAGALSFRVIKIARD